jgi:hypothetical protein
MNARLNYLLWKYAGSLGEVNPKLVHRALGYLGVGRNPETVRTMHKVLDAFSRNNYSYIKDAAERSRRLADRIGSMGTSVKRYNNPARNFHTWILNGAYAAEPELKEKVLKKLFGPEKSLANL